MEKKDWGISGEGELIGIYADSFRIGHDAYKFVLDFGQFFEDLGSTKIHARVIIGPENTKVFYEALGESLNQYAERFGSN